MPIGRPLDLTANVATKNITITATEGQTSFSPSGGYRINEIGVYRNGVRLVQGQDYTATDGSSVVLLSAATVGDVLSFAIFDSFNVANTISPNASDQTINGNLTVTGDLVSQGGINTSSNVGFGTTRPDSIARVNNSVILNAGIVTAYQYYGDVSNCSGAGSAGINTTGFSTFKEIAVSGVATFKGAIDANSTSDFGANVAISAGNLKVTAGIVTVGAGVTISSDFIHLGDNKKIQLGIASDLTIQHNGSNSVINNTTGQIRIAGDDLRLMNKDEDETYATFANDGAATLYNDNSAKFNTAGAGVSITGGVQVSSGGTFGSHNANAAVYYGDGSNLTGISTAAVPGISTQLHSVFGTITASGIITATGSIKTTGISSIFVGGSTGGDGTREGSFMTKHSIGIGTTTTVGRAAGVGTQVGTMIYDVNEEGLQVYNGASWIEVADVAKPFSASGGTKSTTDRSGWAVHTFNGTGTLVVTGTPMPAADYLIVGGGGGGGAGGGGAGGYRTSTTFPIVPGTYTVSIGGGGAGSNPNGGSVGTPSYIDSPGISSITSEGGGGGAKPPASIGARMNGGSGGGGSRDGGSPGGVGDRVAGTDTPAPEQGESGGNTSGSGGFRGGSGGGGADTAGGSGNGQGTQSGNERAGNGGNGNASSIDGESLKRAAGGGGGSQGNGPNSTGLGGQGGGGRGGHQGGQDPTAGTDTFGGGGGGNCSPGGIYCPTGGSQQGGSGIIIIAYPTS